MATVTLDFSKPHVLRNTREYDAAVAEIDELLDRKRLSREEEDRLEFLTLLVEAYDEAHYPMGERSTPQSIVDFLLEQNGMTRAELAPLLGGRSRVSDFFSGKRPHLSLGQIAKLREHFNVAADLLIPVERANTTDDRGAPPDNRLQSMGAQHSTSPQGTRRSKRTRRS